MSRATRTIAITSRVLLLAILILFVGMQQVCEVFVPSVCFTRRRG